MSGKGELLLPDVPRLGVADIDQLVGIRAEKGLALIVATGQRVISAGSDKDAALEVLRLAHLGAVVEAAIQDGSGQSARQISSEASRRWRELTGLVG